MEDRFYLNAGYLALNTFNHNGNKVADIDPVFW